MYSASSSREAIAFRAKSMQDLALASDFVVIIEADEMSSPYQRVSSCVCLAEPRIQDGNLSSWKPSSKVIRKAARVKLLIKANKAKIIVHVEDVAFRHLFVLKGTRIFLFTKPKKLTHSCKLNTESNIWKRHRQLVDIQDKTSVSFVLYTSRTKLVLQQQWKKSRYMATGWTKQCIQNFKEGEEISIKTLHTWLNAQDMKFRNA